MNEPNSLPDLFVSWEEWRAAYASYKADYVQGRIDRPELRKLYRDTLRFQGDEVDRELDLAEQERQLWRWQPKSKQAT